VKLISGICAETGVPADLGLEALRQLLALNRPPKEKIWTCIGRATLSPHQALVSDGRSIFLNYLI
jgi:hypothetical protein